MHEHLNVNATTVTSVRSYMEKNSGYKLHPPKMPKYERATFYGIPYKKCIDPGHNGGWSQFDDGSLGRNNMWELTSNQYVKREIDGLPNLIRLSFLAIYLIDGSRIISMFDTNELMLENLNKLKTQNPNLVWIQEN